MCALTGGASGGCRDEFGCKEPVIETQTYFRPRRIAFAGSSSEMTKANAAFCHALGAWFAANTRDVLITAGFKKAPNGDAYAGDWYFIEGVRSVLTDPAQCMDRVETLRHARDTQTETGGAAVDRFHEGRVVQAAQPVNAARRFVMADRADAVVAVCGSARGGTSQIALFALATDTPLLAVPSFGGGVQELWQKNRGHFIEALGIDAATARDWEAEPRTDAAARALAIQMAQQFYGRLSRACFVITPFAEDQMQIYDDIIAPVVTGLGDRPRRLDMLGLAGDVLDQIEDGIRTADYCIAVLDGLRPNILYEIGMAHALRKPVILMNSAGSIGENAPFDIGHHQRIEFDSIDMALKDRLQRAILDLRNDAFL